MGGGWGKRGIRDSGWWWLFVFVIGCDCLCVVVGCGCLWLVVFGCVVVA